jgi:hypothetical protein
MARARAAKSISDMRCSVMMRKIETSGVPALAAEHRMVLETFEGRRHIIILERVVTLAVFGGVLVANTAVVAAQETGTGTEPLPGTGGIGILPLAAALLGLVSLVVGILLWWHASRR